GPEPRTQGDVREARTRTGQRAAAHDARLSDLQARGTIGARNAAIRRSAPGDRDGHSHGTARAREAEAAGTPAHPGRDRVEGRQSPATLRPADCGDPGPTVKIGQVSIDRPVALAPMAGMTDTAFRRLVKRKGGCGLVVTEMVSSEGLVRGIDRTLEYAEYTEEERPVSIQIFGGDPQVMADAAQVVEGMGADVVDINMGCPVPKIAKHHAGCSLMRQPEHAASIVRAMAAAVKIPVTVKMRAGWNESEINAPLLARMVEDAGASALAVHGRTAAQSYTGERSE